MVLVAQELFFTVLSESLKFLKAQIMSIVFNWSIGKIQVIPEQDDKKNIVTRVEWLLKAVDEVNKMTSSVSGSRSFKLGSNFVPYEQLTEAQVLDWCFAFENFKADAEAQVIEKIERQLAQKIIEPTLPWVTVAQPA